MIENDLPKEMKRERLECDLH